MQFKVLNFKYRLVLLIAGLILFIPFRVKDQDLVSHADKVKLNLGASITFPSTRSTTAHILLSKTAINGITIPMGTYARSNSCTLSMTIDKQMQSQSVDCRTIQDNSYAVFLFPKDIPRGIHEVEIHWDGQAGNELAYYGFKDQKENQVWILPHAAEHYTSFGALMFNWALNSWFSCLAYLSCIIIVLYQTLYGRPNYRSQLITVITLLIAIILIFKPYSGFDETAHIDMLYQSLIDPLPQDRTAFYTAVRDHMEKSDFPTLHHVQLQEANQCPHTVIGHCGITAAPMRLYGFYKTMLTPLSSYIDFGAPSHLRAIGIGFSIFWLLLTFLFSWFMLGSSGVFALSILIPIYGGLLAEFPTISNDVPLTYLGVVYTILLASLLQPIPMGRKAVGLIVSVLLCWLAFPIDRNVVVALPILLTSPFFLWFGTLQKSQVNKLPPVNCTEIFSCGLLALSIAAIFWFVKALLVSDLFHLSAFIQAQFTDGALFANLRKFNNPLVTATFLWQYMRSFFGSFVWGHSYYHPMIYYFMALPFIAISVLGYVSLNRRYSRLVSSALFIGMGFLIFAQWIAILSAYIPGIDAANIVRDSYLKTRLTAPGIGGLLVPFFLGTLWGEKNRTMKGLMSKFVKAWVLCLLCYYFPLFFMADAL